jgi:predicted signal transduction protein with EAL and GGDEF domain
MVAADMDVDLHVNIGASRLGDPAIEQEVSRTMARNGMDPSRLVLEITETVPIVDLADAAAEITRLNALGVKVALDDFGAGYNSLTYLHALPVQIVKLDRSMDVGAVPDRDGTLYRSVIGLCDALELEVIAEGIETGAQAETSSSPAVAWPRAICSVNPCPSLISAARRPRAKITKTLSPGHDPTPASVRVSGRHAAVESNFGHARRPRALRSRHEQPLASGDESRQDRDPGRPVRRLA